MNIKEAKQQIIQTIQAYLDKDETGAYTIPPQRQRPILLMGPPGIGKTAIMEQVAQECGIGLVSYTITHHTRQSAIGLPFITKKKYGEKDYSVTEYTMSEIIAAVYDQIEASGLKEGILFLDEINCVSETLAPTMLQFLQYKTFGSHHVPDGFLIVTAGNPPQYNKSVRDFDIVTLDRLRRIDIEEDFSAFKEYASRAGMHGSVMAYLGIRTNHFYSIRTEVEGRRFVTARGWEDLSRTIQVHEKRNLPVDQTLVVQFLQDPEIAGSFAAYYDLYQKYREVYRVPDILEGRFLVEGDEPAFQGAESDGFSGGGPDLDAGRGREAFRAPEEGGSSDALYLDAIRIQQMQEAPFDEKLSLISLLIDALGQSFAACAREKAIQELLMKELKKVRDVLKAADPAFRPSGADAVLERSAGLRRMLQRKKEAGLPVSREEEHVLLLACRALEELSGSLAQGLSGISGRPAEHREHREAGAAGASGEGLAQGLSGKSTGAPSPREQYAAISEWFSARERERMAGVRAADLKLTNVFRFLSRVYGDGQEMVLFLTELSGGYYSVRFLNEHGNEAFFRYNRLLLLRGRRDALREEVLQLME